MDPRLKRRWMTIGGAVVVTAIIAVIAVMAAFPRSGGVVLDAERVVVAPLRNETGDPSLDPLGRQAGNWITQGLQQTGIVQVVSWEMALQSSLYVLSEAEAGRIRDRLGALAEETEAGTVIAGAYYQRGDSIQYQLEVTDAAAGRLLGSLGPLSAPSDYPDRAIETLRQRVMGFLAVNFDERISNQASSTVRPPSFEAYREFDQGLEAYVHDPRDQDALPHLIRAFELDTTFVTSLVYATFIFNNNSQWAQSDSLTGVIEQRRDRLTEYDRHYLDYLKARVNGDHQEALRAMRRAGELAPGSKAVYNRALIALWMNRPQEALDALLSLDPERGQMRGFRAYWNQLTSAYVALGRYEEALEVLERMKQRFQPHSSWPANEILALVALGRIEDLNEVVNDFTAQSQPYGSSTIAWLWCRVLEMLSAHGYADATTEVVNQALEWFDVQPRGSHVFQHSIVLFFAGRLEEAQAMVAANADDPSQTDIGYRAWRGFYSACRDDTAQALRDLEWLANLDVPYLHGRNELWRGAITGALGNYANAVALLEQAYQQGFNMYPIAPYYAEFVPLRDYPPFQELMRPKG